MGKIPKLTAASHLLQYCGRKRHGVLSRLHGSEQHAGLAVGGFRIQAARITIGSMTPSGSWLLTLAALPCLAAVTDQQCTDLLQHALSASNPETRKMAVARYISVVNGSGE